MDEGRLRPLSTPGDISDKVENYETACTWKIISVVFSKIEKDSSSQDFRIKGGKHSLVFLVIVLHFTFDISNW